MHAAKLYYNRAMQISRLFEIVYLLLKKENITAADLAERFAVSKRTIYRDIDILSGAGIPIYAVQGKGGGLRLLPGFALAKSLLTKEEQKSIIAALQSFSAVNVSDADTALDKLGALFKSGAPDWIAVDFADWGRTSKEKFELLREAILTRCIVNFTYYNSQCVRSERMVEPQQLWFKHRAWYLKGVCLTRKEPRIFKLNRMRDIKLGGFCSGKYDDVEFQPGANVPAGVLVQLHIAAQLAHRVYDEFEEGRVEKCEDGSYIVSMAFIEDEWLYGYLLSFGPFARVIEPEHVREQLQRLLTDMQKNYS